MLIFYFGHCVFVEQTHITPKELLLIINNVHGTWQPCLTLNQALNFVREHWNRRFHKSKILKVFKKNQNLKQRLFLKSKIEKIGNYLPYDVNFFGT